MVEKCTLFAPDSRYQSVDEIEQELKKLKKVGFNYLKNLVIIAGAVGFCVMAGLVWREFTRLNAQIDDLLTKSETIVADDSLKEDIEKN